MNVLDLFSGIGGFSLGLERAGGFKTVGFCEIDPYCRKVLGKHWPDVPIYDDIRKLNGSELNDIGLICGGYPCQPFSVAGKREGRNDDRYLWPEMLRLISEARPTWVIAENVAGITSMVLEHSAFKMESRTLTRTEDEDYFLSVLTRQEIMLLDHVCKDLERENYEVQPLVIPACAVDARHRRDRVWIVANANGGGLSEQDVCEKQQGRTKIVGTGEAMANPAIERPPNDKGRCQATEKPGSNAVVASRRRIGEPGWWCPEPDVGQLVDGVSARLARHWRLIQCWYIIMAYGKKTQTKPLEILRVLRQAIAPERLQEWSIRGSCYIPTTQVLLAFLCELEKIGGEERDLAMEGKEVPSGLLRSMWPDGSIACPSCGWGFHKSCQKQPPDSLHTLSQLLARHAGAAWVETCSKDAPLAWKGLTVSRVSKDIHRRVDRLKGLGNAVVPQIPEIIGRAIMEAEATINQQHEVQHGNQ